MKRTLSLVSLFLLPVVAFGAGFAKQSIFLSRSAVMEGDTVLIHAVVENDSADKFPGEVVITDGSTKVGTVPTTLAAGEARAVSLSWTPAAGNHTITAELLDSAGTVVESESATFDVAAKPKPAAKITATTSEAAAVESSQGIQKQIGNLSPTAEGAAAPVFKLVDSGREALAGVLDGQLASVKPKLTPTPLPGLVEGAQTVKLPDEQSWFWSILYTVYYYILTVLRFLVGSAAVFYPLLCLAFFYILWRTFKRFRRA
jgi:hypothetical protein